MSIESIKETAMLQAQIEKAWDNRELLKEEVTQDLVQGC
jgi:hypothetical protein